MKKVLITGSEGFVGQHLWKELEVNGYEVVGTSLEKQSSGNKRVLSCNILEKRSLDEIIASEKPDYIIHLAGQASPGLSFTKPQSTLEINTIGTINLLEAIKDINNYSPRILLIGTAEEHGHISSEYLPINEDSEFNPANPYGVSKMSNWFLSKIYVKSYSQDIIYAVPFNHTGPGQMPGFLAPDIASQIAEIEANHDDGTITTGNLETSRDISDVRDVVRAYRLLLEKGKTGERYVICSGTATPVIDIVTKLISLSTKKVTHQIDPKKIRPSDNPVLYGSYQKINQATGWKPEISLEKTLKDLLDWYRSRLK